MLYCGPHRTFSFHWKTLQAQIMLAIRSHSESFVVHLTLQQRRVFGKLDFLFWNPLFTAFVCILVLHIHSFTTILLADKIKTQKRRKAKTMRTLNAYQPLEICLHNLHSSQWSRRTAAGATPTTADSRFAVFLFVQFCCQQGREEKNIFIAAWTSFLHYFFLKPFIRSTSVGSCCSYESP